MVITSILSHADFGSNNHQKDASLFITYFHQRKVVRDIVECIDADGDGKISMNEFLTAFKDEIGVGPEGIVKARVWQAQTVDLGSNMKFVRKIAENFKF